MSSKCHFAVHQIKSMTVLYLEAWSSWSRERCNSVNIMQAASQYLSRDGGGGMREGQPNERDGVRHGVLPPESNTALVEGPDWSSPLNVHSSVRCPLNVRGEIIIIIMLCRRNLKERELGRRRREWDSVMLKQT